MPVPAPPVSPIFFATLCIAATASGADDIAPPPELARFFQPPAEFAGKLSPHRSPLLFNDGREVKTAAGWQKRRAEILKAWHDLIGDLGPVMDHNSIQRLQSTHRENFTQHRIRMQIAPDQNAEGYLLIPDGKPPFPAVFVPYYDPETSVGLTDKPFRDFAYQLAKRGFVTLAIGSPGGDARKPVLSSFARCQPLTYLAGISASVWNQLALSAEVDSKRVGIVGHSYGGKWAMFGSCLWEKYACAVWSDPGIVFDEQRPSVNYWEPWYLGLDANVTHKPGLITPDNPRTGAYKILVESGHDLHELHALMAPRPFMVSGGSEDFPARWPALNHAIAVNNLLGFNDRVAMTNRPKHDPNEESNAQIYAFFERWLK